MSVEQIKEVGKTPLLYIGILAAFLGAFGMWLQLTTPSGITGRPVQTGSIGFPSICTSAMTTLPFMVLLVMGGLSRLQPIKSRVNRKNLTYIYIVSLISSYYLGWLGACASWGVFLGNRIQHPEDSVQYIPWFMAPTSAIAEQIVLGGIATPWGDLLTSMIFWWIYTVVNAVMVLSIVMIFRRNWIDIERVPFPHVIAAHEILARATPKELGERRASLISPFIIGMVLGVVFQVPLMMSDLFPWFPDIYGWRTNTCSSGQWYITADSPLAGIVGFATAQKDPLGVAIGYLAPLSVLFNIWFWYLICIIILPQIAYTVGYYSGITGLSGCGRIWCGENLAYGDPFKWQAVSVGAAVGLSSLMVVLSRRYLADTINSALGRLSNDRKIELEKNEPVSYRSTYTMLAASVVLLVAMYLTMGTTLASALIIPLSVFVFWLAWVRQIGIAGFYYMGTEKGMALARIFLFPSAPEPLTQDFVLTSYFTQFTTNSPEQAFQVGGNFISSFEAFRMADLTSTNNRNAFHAIVVSIIIIPIACLISYYYTTYTYGLSRIAGQYGSYGCDPLLDRNASADRWNMAPAAAPWIPHFLTGFVITAVLSVLHSRFIWFPLEPVGFTLAISKAVIPWGIWSSALVAWVIKTITLKIGGSKAHENWGVPVATGFIAGYMLIHIVGTIIAHIKFFFPF